MTFEKTAYKYAGGTRERWRGSARDLLADRKAMFAVLLSVAYLLQTLVPYPGGPIVVLTWSLLVPGYALLRRFSDRPTAFAETIALSLAIALFASWLTVPYTDAGLLAAPRLIALFAIVSLTVRRRPL